MYVFWKGQKITKISQFLVVKFLKLFVTNLHENLTQHYWGKRLLRKKMFFSCESDSRIANIRLSVHHKTPQPLRIASIDHQAYQPSSLSIIKIINHWAYQPSNLLPIESIDHWAYWPGQLALSTIELIDHQAYWPSSLSTIEPNDHWAYQAYWPLSLLTIEPIHHQAYQPLIFFCNF